MLPIAVASSYNPLNGLIPPAGIQRSSGSPTAPGAGNPALNTAFAPATTAPAAPTNGAPPIGSGSGGLGVPDWKSLIGSDPGLLAAQADLAASGVSNAADRNAAFQRNIIDYGQLPDLTKAAAALGLSPGDLQGILGPQTGQLAQENTQAGTSILARLNADNTKTIQGIKNALAARGLYRSGETGYQLGQQNQNYTNSQFDANKSLLDVLSGAQGQYVSAEQARQQALAQAASDAADRALQEWMAQNAAGGSSAPAPAAPAPYAPPPTNSAVAGGPNPSAGGYAPINFATSPWARKLIGLGG